MSHDAAIADYVASLAATDASFGCVARLPSTGGFIRYEHLDMSRIFRSSSAPESLLPVDCHAVEPVSNDRATEETFASQSNALCYDSSRAVTTSAPEPQREVVRVGGTIFQVEAP